MLIKDLLNKTHIEHTGEIGLELELEFKEPQIWDLNKKLWTFSEEHSIKNNGYEIVTKYPVSMDSLTPIVEDVCSNINKRGPIQDCPRTSVHVHLNMLNSTVLQVLNCAVAYWLLETPLVRLCGEEREGHHFCLRLKDAEALVPTLCESLDSKVPFLNLGDRVRYAGLNLNALNKFGSIEFRTMRGTTNPVEIVSWVKALHHLCSVAKTFDSPASVFDYFLENTKDKFVCKFLPVPEAAMVLNMLGYGEMMNESASILCALAYHKEWDKWIKTLESKNTTKKKIGIGHNTFDYANFMTTIYDEVPADDYPY